MKLQEFMERLKTTETGFVIAYVKDAMREIAETTNFCLAEKYISIVNGTELYDYPANMVKLIDVLINNDEDSDYYVEDYKDYIIERFGKQFKLLKLDEEGQYGTPDESITNAVKVIYTVSPPAFSSVPYNQASKDYNYDYTTRSGQETLLSTSIALANSIKEEYNDHCADQDDHTQAPDTTNTISSDDATNLPTLITLITELLTDYDAHDEDVDEVSPTYHAATSTVNDLASTVAPTTLAECATRINDLRAKFILHDADTTSHEVGGQYVITTATASTASIAVGDVVLVLDGNSTSSSITGEYYEALTANATTNLDTEDYTDTDNWTPIANVSSSPDESSYINADDSYISAIEQYVRMKLVEDKDVPMERYRERRFLAKKSRSSSLTKGSQITQAPPSPFVLR